MDNFGEQLKGLRESKKISQEGLADALGVHQTTISGIERNERLPSATLLLAFSAFFDVPLDKLMDKPAWDASRAMVKQARNRTPELV